MAELTKEETLKLISDEELFGLINEAICRINELRREAGKKEVIVLDREIGEAVDSMICSRMD